MSLTHLVGKSISRKLIGANRPMDDRHRKEKKKWREPVATFGIQKVDELLEQSCELGALVLAKCLPVLLDALRTRHSIIGR